MQIIKKTPQPMIYSTNIAKSAEPRPIECRRSFCSHDHSKDKYFRVGRRPTDGMSLDHHHTRKHAKDIEPHYMTSISCSRALDVPLNPWQSCNVLGYARAGTIFNLFDYLKEKKPNSWDMSKSSEKFFMKMLMQRRRPTGNQSLNYHHTRKHAKDIEPHCFKTLKCGRLHHVPVQQWNASNQPDYAAANTVHRLFGNIRERKLKARRNIHHNIGKSNRFFTSEEADSASCGEA
ncbi:hypothetical protein R1flu_028728 [Riccia fluitans]|uniref:Uncharacterized protein n=1 Tax=Riccia fluitans TaxID=41844 RepID=A0ABD1XMK7_9MARC